MENVEGLPPQHNTRELTRVPKLEIESWMRSK